MPQSRSVLHVQAVFWRVLMSVGMFLHRMAPPRPPRPTFSKTIKSTVSPLPGSFKLYFYTPKDYHTQEQQGFKNVRGGKGYPVLINFHGGGFTIGTSADDARWAHTVVHECHAVVISVEYRLAPEHPFPTAVEDGVDAVLWVARHSPELGLDADKIALSGFSSGGNMAFTVPLLLYDHVTDYERPTSRPVSHMSRPPSVIGVESQQQHQPESSTTTLTPENNLLSPESAGQIPAETSDDGTKASYKLKLPVEQPTSSKDRANTVTKPVIFDSLCAIVPWYPSIDYTRTREQRRATCARKDQELPAIFTNLFDESYLHPPDTVPLSSPYLSPGTASDGHLRLALPDNIILHTCEWDMLLQEADEFKDRLSSPRIGKKLTYHMVEGVPHGWDKAPNPISPTPGVREHYLRACAELTKIFDGPDLATRDSGSIKPVVN